MAPQAGMRLAEPSAKLKRPFCFAHNYAANHNPFGEMGISVIALTFGSIKQVVQCTINSVSFLLKIKSQNIPIYHLLVVNII